MADMDWLENKLKWTGSYKNKKDDELLIGNISVGEADPVGIFKPLGGGRLRQAQGDPTNPQVPGH